MNDRTDTSFIAPLGDRSLFFVGGRGEVGKSVLEKLSADAINTEINCMQLKKIVCRKTDTQKKIVCCRSRILKKMFAWGNPPPPPTRQKYWSAPYNAFPEILKYSELPEMYFICI